jgi:serine/threonine protein kinase
VKGRATAANGDGPRRVVAGHYTVDLDALLGQGGMALVYRGRDLRTRRDVALKTLRLEYRHDPDTRARFRKEARTMAFLRHPNVARLYDLYEDDEAPWAVLEYVPGASLKDLLRTDGPFNTDTTAAILEQVADALAHLHNHGLVHLDVKPQNILMTPDGVVKLIDFGLAQHAGGVQELIGGSAFGTAAYLSPEQACGEPVDATTDVYALGCVVYELLTGRPPFEPAGDGEVKNDIIRAHLEQDPEPPTAVRPDLPSWVDDVVLEALAKRPEDRYQNVSSFAELFLSRLDPMLDDSDDLDSTSRLLIPTVVDAYRASEPDRPTGAGMARRTASSLYRTGGKVARRSRRLSRPLWRLVAALVVANLMLGLIVLYHDGYLPGTTLDAPRLEAGATAEVTTNGLRVRAGPGTVYQQVGLAVAGDRLEITGDETIVGDEIWWPVRLQQDGVEIDGFVWAGGLKAAPVGPVHRFQHAIDEIRGLPGEAGDGLRNLRERLP